MWTTRPVSDRAPDGTAFALTGPVDAPVVVFIHGLGLSQRLFDPHLPAFADYRCLTYDLFGHGGSGPSSEVATLDVYARQLCDLLDHLDVAQAHIVGFSIGGMINRRFALDYPDRVASLVILNAPHNRGPDMQAGVEDRALAAREQGAFATFDAAVARWFTPDHVAHGAGPGLVRAWREQVDDDSYAQASWVLASGVPELIAPDPPITARTLVMTCECDIGSTPAMSRDIAQEIAGAQFIIVPRYQHLGLIEDPSAFSAPILAFLEG